jgi:hypothetical protein
MGRLSNLHCAIGARHSRQSHQLRTFVCLNVRLDPPDDICGDERDIES